MGKEEGGGWRKIWEDCWLKLNFSAIHFPHHLCHRDFLKYRLFRSSAGKEERYYSTIPASSTKMLGKNAQKRFEKGIT